MHKLNLVGVKLVSKEQNKSGRDYYKFVGKFEFVYPLFFDEKKIQEFMSRKSQILVCLSSINDYESNCITHKYTKKLRINGKVKEKDSFQYVFDIIPKNILDFEFQNGKMNLYVIGYGM